MLPFPRLYLSNRDFGETAMTWGTLTEVGGHGGYCSESGWEVSFGKFLEAPLDYLSGPGDGVGDLLSRFGTRTSPCFQQRQMDEGMEWDSGGKGRALSKWNLRPSAHPHCGHPFHFFGESGLCSQSGHLHLRTSQLVLCVTQMSQELSFLSFKSKITKCKSQFWCLKVTVASVSLSRAADGAVTPGPPCTLHKMWKHLTGQWAPRGDWRVFISLFILLFGGFFMFHVFICLGREGNSCYLTAHQPYSTASEHVPGWHAGFAPILPQTVSWVHEEHLPPSCHSEPLRPCPPRKECSLQPAPVGEGALPGSQCFQLLFCSAFLFEVGNRADLC